ncbi:TPA: 50S ribosomal protein L3 [Candidatus Beckwithbacteria bacterium]|nr:MAG: 50S ribosomal protein L3 [Candidatus Beckwithbacteria bacterium RIFCSPHIGHO2_01_FULL_49_39]OGD50791.1 MAG: 50S ribosomal protein L3 [Candidatus Beckwithbacteria bacterium RIFCSPHIGHO2_12_FULL_49_13]OGD52081.1 MAG: 50S ribosomal protein L3 [Candidatus Beckwithbacteria bacterium RIFCSPHIGHO2_02_FULL_49_13]OGD58438.1 MAG: 50S ribosomal protein L3 [Candidatus Beckwithbacteria bacterium RIFCSPLOWO2_02_FULL_49_12]OGD59561.1 MAG: 50S ribosomal protein L3 [Candidatus Beckwithbacteria bacterium 
MINSFYGTKFTTTQAFDAKGRRQVVSVVKVEPLVVTQVKTLDRDGYWGLKVGIGQKSVKRGAKKAKGPRFLREIKLESEPELKPGDLVPVDAVLKPQDKVKVTGISLGRGFAGVMKRHGFAGGPKTHGQSDRARAPGSIGMRTDPGRVWKGKKMAGHYGAATVTVKNCQVVSVSEADNLLTLTGTVPGFRKGLLKLTKI